MSPTTEGTALRAVARAVENDLTVNRPGSLDIYGRGLTTTEIVWLCDAMPDAQLGIIPGTPAGEDMQLVGTLVGRVVRVLLVGRAQAGLVGDLRQAIDRRARAGAL